MKPGNVNPLAGLKVQHVIATGRSQSAFRLVTHINALHHSSRVFNGFLIHSRGANAAGLSAAQLNRDPDPIPAGARLRDDAGVPVLDLQAEGDMVALRSHTTRQPDHTHYRRWEIAGAAHAESPQWIPGITPVPDMAPGLRCASPINSAPHHAVVKAALHALTRWVRDGVAARSSAPAELGDPAAPDPITRDAFGIAKGGIRLPEVEAPTARIDGLRNDVPPGAPGGQNFCFLFGRTEPFDAATLTKAYPTRFEIGWLDPGGDIGAVSRDHVAIFFRRRGRPFEPAVHWVFAADLDATYEELRSRGARIVEPIEKKPWGVRQFTVEDVDGHRYYFHCD